MPWPGLWTSTEARKETNDASLKQRTERGILELKTAIKDEVNDLSTKQTPATATIVNAFAEPQNILATIVLTSTCLGLLSLYRRFLRRFPEATNINPTYFRRRSILGKVTSVGDGDNFRIYHTPGGWLAGWGWLPWRRVPTDKKMLKNKTIHVRIAGVDAPELAHFGRPAQPFSQEALDWLTLYLRGRRVRAHVYKLDQYNRVVATAYVWKGLMKRDIGLQMIRAGFATVYEAKSGAEFGDGLESKYRQAERWAKLKRIGMWSGDKASFESPRQYKTRHNSTG